MGAGSSGTSTNYTAAIEAGSALVKGGAAFAGGLSQASAYKMQGDYQKQTAELNAKLAEAQAADSLKRGDKAVSQQKKQTKRLIGDQRANLAAQGINIDSGSALDIQGDSAQLGAEDAITIKNNAWREAWGFKTEALTQRASGNFASNYYNFAANNTLLTGGLNSASELLKGGYALSKVGGGSTSSAFPSFASSSEAPTDKQLNDWVKGK